MFKVVFNYDDRPLRLNQKREVQSFIARLFKKEKKALERLDYVFCSDERLLQINRDFLKHDFFTDIITFDLSVDENITSGEIYISTDRVKENAALLKTGYEEEMLRVLFHGALHLCGYTDKRKHDVIIMRQKEDYYIALYKQNKRST